MRINRKTDTPLPESERTDERLRTDSKNTDRVIADSRTRTDDAADEIVERAREHADAVLDSAREKADHKLDLTNADAHTRDVVAKERVGEDDALKGERAAADESLRRERVEQARTLAALLPLEREKTDRFLLTERVRSDDAVSHRDDFLGIVSHDLRNLLGGIAGTTRLLLAQAGGADECATTVAAAERIQRYVARMNRLIGDLVDVVSIDAGKLFVRPQPNDPSAVIAEAVDAFAHAAQEKGVVLTAERTKSLPSASFDHDRLIQVLANLITNAIKFTPPGGTVTISAEQAPHELVVSVHDTGIGIAADRLDAVFERFWQAGENDHRGLGLGLYISKCIVVAHAGRIWVESQPGEGSTFYFTLPAGEAASA